MPTTRRRTRRPSQAQPWQTEYLLTGYYTKRSGEKSRIRVFMYGETLPIWADVKNELLPGWIKEHPCTRPFAWYREEAPEPRRRMGGTGLRSEHNTFEFGIPGAHWWRDVDPKAPPLYESEAAFLQRHGFLTTQEKKFLAENPALLEPVEIEYEIAINPDVHSVGHEPPKWIK